MVLSRGPQNEQTIEQAKSFLSDNRASTAAVFKRQAKVGGVFAGDEEDLDKLVDLYTLLITLTEFLAVSKPDDLNHVRTTDAQQYEDQRDFGKRKRNGFS